METEFRFGCYERSDGSYNPIFQVKCPKCGVWMTIDEDQLHGRVSILCNTSRQDTKESCGFHAYLKSSLQEV